MVVQLPDDGRNGAQLQCGVINVGGGSVDGFEELGGEIEEVSGDIQKSVVLGNLVGVTSASGSTRQNNKTNLL